MSDPVSLESSGGVAIVHLDDGKANALSPAVIEALGKALDQAVEDTKDAAAEAKEEAREALDE